MGFRDAADTVAVAGHIGHHIGEPRGAVEGRDALVGGLGLLRAVRLSVYEIALGDRVVQRAVADLLVDLLLDRPRVFPVFRRLRWPVGRTRGRPTRTAAPSDR